MKLQPSIVFQSEEVAYAIANRLAPNLNFGVNASSFICGTLFSVGLVAFFRLQALPFKSPTLACPSALPPSLCILTAIFSR